MSVWTYLLDNPTAVVSAVGATFALLTLRSNRHLAKAKHTLDFDKDFKEKHKDTLRNAQRVFQAMTPAELRALGRTGRLSEQKDDAFTALVAAVNLWESVAIGIRQKIYLEELLFASAGTTISILYLQTIPFVKGRQEQNPRLFTNFTWLGLRWTVRLSQPLAKSRRDQEHKQIELKEAQEARERLRSEVIAELTASGWSPPSEMAQRR